MDPRKTSRSGVDDIARPALIIGEGVRKQSVTQAQAMEDAGAVKPLLKKTSSPAELTMQ